MVQNSPAVRALLVLDADRQWMWRRQRQRQRHHSHARHLRYRGTVSGLNIGTQVVVLNNACDTKTVTVNGTFATPLASRATFAVTVGTAPAGKPAG